jgi:hypothetical protein
MQRVRKFSVKLGLRSVILQCNFFFPVLCEQDAVQFVLQTSWSVTQHFSRKVLISSPFFLNFFLRFITFPPLLFLCHELTILFNIFTAFNDRIRQCWQDPILSKFAGWFPYLWKLWNISSFHLRYVENIWWRKDSKCMALASPCPKTWFPPQQIHVSELRPVQEKQLLYSMLL